MKDQHTKIKGYRDLSQAEIDLMNEIKAHGERTRELLAKVRESIADAGDTPEGASEGDHPLYWLRYADGSFRSATMYLVRAVARPQSF
jgi:hypothetical protein